MNETTKIKLSNTLGFLITTPKEQKKNETNAATMKMTNIFCIR